jgi:hypothetical protein
MTMTKHKQLQKFISVLMIFILLTFFIGCTSSRIVSTSNLPSKSSKYGYVIHGEKIKFLLEKKSTISNYILSGKIKQTYYDDSYDAGNKIHLYLRSDSVIKIDIKGEYLSVPLIHVTKAEVQEIHGVWVSIILISLALVVFVGVVSMNFTGLLNP